MKRILVTGHRGYIGVHLIQLLKESGYRTTGCDLGFYDGCEWEPYSKPDEEWNRDFRELTIKDLEGHDCVMHLAAISNDPMGDLDPEFTKSINRDGTIRLANLAKEAGLSCFLFASSCSIYGKGAKLDLSEEDTVAPLTAYAESKIEAEKAILKLHDQAFCVSSLRNATAYGHSPMLRIDLVVNNLLGCALARGDIRVMSDGSPWRPLIHCRDIARAFIAFVKSPEAVGGKAINVGGNKDNYTVRQVLEEVEKLVPTASVVYTGEVGADPRNYRVRFDRLNQLLPHFKLEYNLKRGVEELFQKYQEHQFSKDDFEGDQFVRLRTLKKRLSVEV